MIGVEGLSKRFGNKRLFEGVNLSFPVGKVIGVLGPNGAGKTTFFKILTGREAPDAGNVLIPKGLRIAELEQEWEPEAGVTVLDAALSFAHEWRSAQKEMASLERQMSESSSEADMLAYGRAQDRFLAKGGHGLVAEAKEILGGLGFDASTLKAPATSLSGGWRVRIQLAGQFLGRPDMLLLDEPTNHLDLPSMIWLEGFLRQFEKTVLIISHDRSFLGNLSDMILEFLPPKITLWNVGLAKFEVDREKNREGMEADFKEKVREMQRLEAFADKFRAKASKARQAQNKLKTAEKFRTEVDTLREELSYFQRSKPQFSIQVSGRLPKVALNVDKLKIGYDSDKPLFTLNQLMIGGKAKLGIVGVNGAGKSTFLKTCAGMLEPLGGELSWSSQTKWAYFAQHRQDILDVAKDGISLLTAESTVASPQEAYQMAAGLGLIEEDLKKPLEALSGGEKTRLALARMFLRKPEFLMLDEPTNHLDLESTQALEDALAQFQGGLLIATHHRGILKGVVDQIIEIDGDNAKVESIEALDRILEPKDLRPGSSADKVEDRKQKKDKKRQEAQMRQKRHAIEKDIRSKQEVLEARLEALKAEKAQLESKMCHPDAAKQAEFVDWLKRSNDVEKDISDAEFEWLDLEERKEGMLESLN